MTKSVSEQVLKGLMLLSLDGDEAAYRRLLVILRDLLLAFYRRRLGSNADRDAEDLLGVIIDALPEGEYAQDEAAEAVRLIDL